MKRLIAFATVAMLSTSAWATASDEFNARVDPLGLIIGLVQASVDIKVAPEWTIGPELSYWHFKIGSTGTYTSDFDLTAWGVAARANWFYNGAYTDGFYVGPKVGYAAASVNNSDSTGYSSTKTASSFMVGCLVGYGWFWDNFNMMLGGGGNIALGDNSVKFHDSNGTSYTISTRLGGFAFEYSLGYTF